MGSACGSTAARSQWPGSGIRRSIGLQALPLDGGGLGGGDASANTSQEMKRYLPRGAAARARNLRQNMTEAEIRVWRMLRAHRMNGHKFRRQVPIGRYMCATRPGWSSKSTAANTIVRRRGKPSEVAFCKRRAIAFCGFGTTRSWQIPTVSMRQSSTNWRHHPHPALPHPGGGGARRRTAST